MNHSLRGVVAASLAAMAAMTMVSPAQAATVRGAVAPVAAPNVVLVPSGKGYGVPVAAGAVAPGADASTATSNGIIYHGGPVMNDAGGVNVYVVWYGDWDTQSPTAKTIVRDYLNNLTGSPRHNINTSYYAKKDKPKFSVKNIVNLKTEIDDAAKSAGSSLSDTAIRSLVTNAISSGKLPSDPNGLYFVMTSKDVTASSGFCTRYCGWHNFTTFNSVPIKFSFVGDAARCLSACSPTQNRTKSPNDNPGVDAMLSVIQHELEEAATDPQLNAWYDASGMENADKCAWKFGTTQTAPNGSTFNMTLGARNFLIQQNWVNDFGGLCDMKY